MDLYNSAFIRIINFDLKVDWSKWINNSTLYKIVSNNVFFHSYILYYADFYAMVKIHIFLDNTKMSSHKTINC